MNIKVIWIGKNIKYLNGILTSVILKQHSLIIERTLITYNPEERLIRYECLQAIDKHRFIGYRREIQWEHLLEDYPLKQIPNLVLTDRAYQEYLAKCRKQKNVLEPTLSLLYNARLIHKKRRPIIGILYLNKYIFNTLYTWQSYLF